MSLSRLFSYLLNRLFPSRRARDADAYLHAAEILHSGGKSFACTALNFALILDGRSHNALVQGFADWFKPEDEWLHGPWWGSDLVAENQEARILALLLMAEITLGGD